MIWGKTRHRYGCEIISPVCVEEPHICRAPVFDTYMDPVEYVRVFIGLRYHKATLYEINISSCKHDK